MVHGKATVNPVAFFFAIKQAVHWLVKNIFRNVTVWG